MKELKFKTNINCNNCLSKVKPFLENETTIEKWEVDLQSSDRILTVTGNEELTTAKVIETVKKSGFSISELNN